MPYYLSPVPAGSPWFLHFAVHFCVVLGHSKPHTVEPLSDAVSSTRLWRHHRVHFSLNGVCLAFLLGA
jgi:hypothetical protein